MEVTEFCDWIVASAVLGIPGLSNQATTDEAVSTAKTNRMRFIVSSFGLAADNQPTCAA